MSDTPSTEPTPAPTPEADLAESSRQRPGETHAEWRERAAREFREFAEKVEKGLHIAGGHTIDNPPESTGGNA